MNVFKEYIHSTCLSPWLKLLHALDDIPLVCVSKSENCMCTQSIIVDLWYTVHDILHIILIMTMN